MPNPTGGQRPSSGYPRSWLYPQELGSLDFDAVADWVAFTPERIQTDLELFHGRTGQVRK